MNFLSWRGPEAQLTVTEIGLIKEILNNRDGMFTKRKCDILSKKLIRDGIIVTSEYQKWSKLRKLSNHAFHADSLKGMIPAMITSVEMMLENWRQYEAQDIDVSKEFKILASEVISRTGFGSSYLEGQHIFDMLMQLGFIIHKDKHKLRISGIEKLVKSKDDMESDKIEEDIQKGLMKMIKKREDIAILKQSDSFGDDFLGLLIKANHETDMSKKISVDELIDECKIFYIAGQETTATSLTWTLFFLAIHTDWQHKAREEVFQLLGTNNPCPQTLPKLKIMSMIINEVLRLYSPATLLIQRTKREVNLGEIVIPENVNIEIPILAMHHSSQIWGEDVHMFKPDRFAEGIAKATNNNVAAYLPFGSGARNCAGLNFALTEIKIALSMILQRYRLFLSPNYVHSPFVFLTMSPQHGLQIMLQLL